MHGMMTRGLAGLSVIFGVGSADMRLVTQRQLTESATHAALLRVQAEQRIQRVNLHLALGGSFEPPPRSDR